MILILYPVWRLIGFCYHFHCNAIFDSIAIQWALNLRNGMEFFFVHELVVWTRISRGKMLVFGMKTIFVKDHEIEKKSLIEV